MTNEIKKINTDDCMWYVRIFECKVADIAEKPNPLKKHSYLCNLPTQCQSYADTNSHTETRVACVPLHKWASTLNYGT